MTAIDPRGGYGLADFDIHRNRDHTAGGCSS